MKLQVLSHAGLAVTHGDTQLLCDPWIVGSTYWRSWWNYPPVPRALVDSLRPTHIYLTHIHWDHFQGASLEKFARETPIIVPSGPYDRMKRDLGYLGFTNVIELGHGKKYSLAPDFSIVSYHFGLFLDSAVVIECDGVTIFNANDAKLMGMPLRQVLRRHPKIDFVLRSHSSANSRLCYEVMDGPGVVLDDQSSYLKSFAKFTQRTGARYAIPFASNHCFLHKEVFAFNRTITTPIDVRDHFAQNGIASPTVQIMTPGSTWSQQDGFQSDGEDFFENREERLAEYAAAKKEKLETFYEQEARAEIPLADVQKYFTAFSAALPRFVRRLYRKHPITLVLLAGERETIFEVSLHDGSVRQLESYDGVANPIQIHTSALIMAHCIAYDLFSHLPISKRVKYRVMRRTKRYVQMLNMLFNLYEYDMLPLRRNFSGRSVGSWITRWRELLLYGRIAFDLAIRRRLDPLRYI
ncbi:MAG TPA: hypothetical protein VGQ76_26455 [Thermoanaerobaculia bacterium]|jgi:UDP-MurNAc hydroxylase|nr:hypothetical protein [Thermoanaerobaculia bacterium]